MPEPDHYETQMQLMHETVLALLSRGLERTVSFPQNGYRRRIYFEGMARLAEDLNLISSAAAVLVRTAGRDIQGRQP
jgi:hypothetical protein